MTKRGRGREALVLLASAAVVVVAVAAERAREGPAQVAAASAATVHLGELPPGATATPSTEMPSDADRGCAIADRGLGDYTEKGPLPMGKLWARSSAVGSDGDYTLLLHLHGGEAVRKLVLPLGLDVELLTVDRGVGSSAYEGTFPTRRAFDELVGDADRRVAEVAGRAAHARRIIVSSWSAGYRGVEDVLAVAGDDPSLVGVVLLDSLHASYPNNKSSLEHGQLARFVGAARRATRDPAFFMHVTHSEIKPPGYASTTETASLLLSEIGVEAERVREGGLDLLPLTRMADEGRFAVRGYAGNDARAHCDELRLLPSILEAHLSR